MSDDPSPEKVLGIVSLVVAAVGGAAKGIGAIVKWFTARIDARIEKIEQDRDRRILKLEAERDEAKLAEKKNSDAMRALLAEIERREGRPHSMPPPSDDEEDEKTEVRRQTDAERRHLIAKTVRGPYRDRQSSIHDPDLQRFLADSTPPETPDAIAHRWPPRRTKKP